ncbi:MAG: energy transducer TonB [Pseudomonadota bacterium]
MTMRAKSVGFGLAAAAMGLAAPLAAQNSEEASANPAPAQSPVNLISVAELSYTPTRETHEVWREFKGSYAADFALTVDATGYPLRCQPFRKDLDRETATTLCLDLLDHAKIRVLKGFSTGGRDAIIGVSKDPHTSLTGIDESSSPFNFRLAELGPSDYVNYAPRRASEGPLVSSTQAKLIDRKKNRKYPIFASRFGYEGTVRVLNTIAPDGSIVGCRPISSSGYAILDNAACAHMLEKARYKLQVGKGAAQDRYYQAVDFAWVLPAKKRRNRR